MKHYGSFWFAIAYRKHVLKSLFLVVNKKIIPLEATHFGVKLILIVSVFSDSRWFFRTNHVNLCGNALQLYEREEVLQVAPPCVFTSSVQQQGLNVHTLLTKAVNGEVAHWYAHW